MDGVAHITNEIAETEPHWNESLTQWFLQGLETPGICMIAVNANTIKYWHNEKNFGNCRDGPAAKCGTNSWSNNKSPQIEGFYFGNCRDDYREFELFGGCGVDKQILI